VANLIQNGDSDEDEVRHMSVKARRVWAWVVGTLCLIIILGLIVTAVLDLQLGDSTSSVIAGIAAVIGLAISMITLIINWSSAPTGSPSAVHARIRSKGRGALAAGGSIRGNAIGKDTRVTGPSTSPSASAPQGVDVSARGTGAMSSGGDIADNAMGEGAER
jgi:hypothetical protein